MKGRDAKAMNEKKTKLSDLVLCEVCNPERLPPYLRCEYCNKLIQK